MAVLRLLRTDAAEVDGGFGRGAASASPLFHFDVYPRRTFYRGG
jgi:hypothetical protein